MDHPTDTQPQEEVTCPQCEQYKQGWQRAMADYHNLQKEIGAMRSEWAVMGEIQVVQEFLPVYDNFKKAFAHDHGTLAKEHENWVTGISYIMKQFGDILKNHGIEEIKTIGEQFSPVLHESIGEEEVSGVAPQTIIKEVDAGYRVKEKVLKVAKVIIAK